MDKKTLFNLLPGILGIFGVILPAIVVPEIWGTPIIYWFLPIPVQDLPIVGTMFLPSMVLFLAGLVLFFFAFDPSLKDKIPAFLPGILMFGGAMLYVIYYLFTGLYPVIGFIYLIIFTREFVVYLMVSIWALVIEAKGNHPAWMQWLDRHPAAVRRKIVALVVFAFLIIPLVMPMGLPPYLSSLFLILSLLPADPYLFVEIGMWAILIASICLIMFKKVVLVKDIAVATWLYLLLPLPVSVMEMWTVEVLPFYCAYAATVALYLGIFIETARVGPWLIPPSSKEAVAKIRNMRIRNLIIYLEDIDQISKEGKVEIRALMERYHRYRFYLVGKLETWFQRKLFYDGVITEDSFHYSRSWYCTNIQLASKDKPLLKKDTTSTTMASVPRFCAFCGNQLQNIDALVICPHCGASLGETAK
ncbi:MAG TPA: hypothetical protein VKM55_01740 [Candidatus Lokiarchaeia archaeon]|nr:hypothetical protein [Candidatus Lokiarchaeia archaeon]